MSHALDPSDLYAPTPARGWLPWGLLAPVLGLIFAAIGDVGGSGLLHLAGLLDAQRQPASPTDLLAYALLPFALLGLLVLAWVRWVERRPLASIGLTGPHPVRRFFYGHAIGLASMGSIVAAIWLLGGYRASAMCGACTSPAALLTIGGLLFGFALQASVEELLFRGWLLSVVTKRLNVVAGVELSSALFVLLHYDAHQPLLVTASNALFALFCCAWVLKSGHVYGVMGWHAGWNWLNAVGYGQPLSGVDAHVPALLVQLDAVGGAWLTGGAYGPEGSVVTVAYFGLAIGGLVTWRRSRRGVAAFVQELLNPQSVSTAPTPRSAAPRP